MSNYPLFNKLCTRSKRYWWKIARNPKKLCNAHFRYPLVERLSKETGMSEKDVYKALYKELAEFVKEHSTNI